MPEWILLASGETPPLPRQSRARPLGRALVGAILGGLLCYQLALCINGKGQVIVSIYTDYHGGITTCAKAILGNIKIDIFSAISRVIAQLKLLFRLPKRRCFFNGLSIDRNTVCFDQLPGKLQ